MRASQNLAVVVVLLELGGGSRSTSPERHPLASCSPPLPAQRASIEAHDVVTSRLGPPLPVPLLPSAPIVLCLPPRLLRPLRAALYVRLQAIHPLDHVRKVEDALAPAGRGVSPGERPRLPPVAQAGRLKRLWGGLKIY